MQDQAAVYKPSGNTFDHDHVLTIRPARDHDFTRVRRTADVGTRIDEHLVTGSKCGDHRGSGNAHAPPEPQ
ncbi:MAG: hypothetical protein P8169_05915 [Chloroflexota bacterium]